MKYVTAIFLIVSIQVFAEVPPPIIDMHLHAVTLAEFGGGGAVCTNDQKMLFPFANPRKPMILDQVWTCPSPLQSAASDDALLKETIMLLERYNIWAVTSGSLENVTAWRAEPDRIIPALSFAKFSNTPAEFRRLFSEGKLRVLAEIGAQYQGRKLGDEAYEPYFALAEELDIPVGVHLGEGPPGGAHLLGGSTTPSPYRAALTSPFQLEEVLIRHPKIRIYVMHYGSPLVDEMIAMLFSHPQLNVDIACNDWGFPREHFYGQLKRLIDAGFEKRIMWGSDQMVWPKTIEIAIKTIEEAQFLTAEQKRDIFYNNAARFLRLSKEEMAKHNSH